MPQPGVMARHRQRHCGPCKRMPSITCEWQNQPPTTATPATSGLALKAMGAPTTIHMWRDPRCPHYQRFLIVIYDLHSKWPELTTTGSVTSPVIVDFLESLVSRWAFHRPLTPTIAHSLYLWSSLHTWRTGRFDTSAQPCVTRRQTVGWNISINSYKMASEHIRPRAVHLNKPHVCHCCTTVLPSIRPQGSPQPYSCWVGS